MTISVKIRSVSIHLAIANHVKAKLAENGVVPFSKVAKVKAKGK